MAQLPPKIPSMTHPNWPPAFPPHQRMPPLTTHPQPPPSWVDEFLDFTSSRRGNHRRSMSDSIAFLEAPLVEECRNSLHGSSGGGSGGGGFDRLDDEQLMSMFSDDISGGMPGMVGPPSSPSDQNSNNDDDNQQQPMSTDNNNDYNNGGKQQKEEQEKEHAQHVPKSEPGEVESACNNNDNPIASSGPASSDIASQPSGGSDSINIDPKRVKRKLSGLLF